MEKSILTERYGILREMTKDSGWTKMVRNTVDSAWDSVRTAKAFKTDVIDMEILKDDLVSSLGGSGFHFSLNNSKPMIKNLLSRLFDSWWVEGRFNGNRSGMMKLKDVLFVKILGELF